MMNCPACGSTDVHRSRAASLAERGRKLLSEDRPHRCRACGWRGWVRPLAHRHAAVATSDGWETVEVDLADLDAASRTAADNRVDWAPAAGPSSHRRSHRHRSRSARHLRSRAFNRRMQMVVFLTLLLVGMLVVMRACAGGARTAQLDAAAFGKAYLPALSAPPARPAPPALILSRIAVVE